MPCTLSTPNSNANLLLHDKPFIIDGSRCKNFTPGEIKKIVEYWSVDNEALLENFSNT